MKLQKIKYKEKILEAAGGKKISFNKATNCSVKMEGRRQWEDIVKNHRKRILCPALISFKK